MSEGERRVEVSCNGLGTGRFGRSLLLPVVEGVAVCIRGSCDVAAGEG